MIEFSDILKRPVDSFKYLLTACETGSVNVGHSIAYLDSVLLGTANEIQLDAFKEFPDFTSFKARIELIRTPYLLSVSQEKQIYDSQLSQFTWAAKHTAPHVTWAVALWSILTRLKKPNSINYPPNVSSLVSNLSPLEKAKLYDSGEVPPIARARRKKSPPRQYPQTSRRVHQRALLRRPHGRVLARNQIPSFRCVPEPGISSASRLSAC